MYNKCIKIAENLFDENNNNGYYVRFLQECYLNYASLLDVEFNENEEAEKYYLKCIDLINSENKKEKEYDSSILFTLANAYKALGYLYYKIGNIDEAEYLFKERKKILLKMSSF